MSNLINVEAWTQFLFQTGPALVAKASAFVPLLAGALAILLVGWLVARLVEAVSRRALRAIGIDRVAGRKRLAALLERFKVRLSASDLVAKGLFWTLMLTAILAAIDTLGLTVVNATLDRLMASIPNLVSAAIILVLGVLAARVLGRFVRSAANAADIRSADRLGVATQAVAVVLVATVAAEELGIATEILVAPATALVGGLTLSAGLTFALGARPIVTHILAGHFLRDSLPIEGFVEVEGERGVIEKIGATATLLRSDSRSWTVPNGRLLEDVVTRL